MPTTVTKRSVAPVPPNHEFYVKNTMNTARAFALFLGLGSLTISAPVFAQTTTAPATGTPATTAPAPVAATPAQAKALFAQVVNRYKSLKSLSATYDDGSFTQSIQFSAPDKAKLTILDSKGATVSQKLYSPTQVTTLQKPKGAFEYTVEPRLAAPEGQDPRTRMLDVSVGDYLFSSFLAGLDPFREEGLFKATSYAQGQPATQDGLVLTPIIVTCPDPDSLFETTFTFYVGQQDKLIHTIQTDFKTPDGTVSKTVEAFSNIQADTALPAGTFDFAPPTGATLVAQFSPVARPNTFRDINTEAPADTTADANTAADTDTETGADTETAPAPAPAVAPPA